MIKTRASLDPYSKELKIVSKEEKCIIDRKSFTRKCSNFKIIDDCLFYVKRLVDMKIFLEWEEVKKFNKYECCRE